MDTSKKKTTKAKQIFRIILFAGTLISLWFVPWILVKAWLLPLPDTVQEQVDQSLSHGFDGVIVYVDEAGKPPAFYAAGYHNRALKTPANPHALFKIASISKLYVAVSITKLAHENRLSLDKTVADYFPELVGSIENANEITLRMMVQHRSGIPNFTDNPDTVGTEISDFMDRTLGLGYALGSMILFTGLIITLWLWYKNLKSINVHPIFSKNEEIYYWIAILFSNSLGTAFGDFLGDVVGLSYLQGALVTAGIIALVVLLHYYSKLNHILLFWIAFIFTRPFGATFGDLLTKPLAKGGLDLGTIPATLVSVVLLLILIIYTTRNQKTIN